LKVHAGRSTRATPSEALFRSTLAASRMMGLDDRFGRLQVDRPMSFVEIACDTSHIMPGASIDEVILESMLEMTPGDLTSCTSGPMRAATDLLSGGSIDTGKEIDLLCVDVDETVTRLDRKVTHVVLDGQVAWQRGCS
jgi:imidazolonepropionase-like amidohydrolase